MSACIVVLEDEAALRDLVRDVLGIEGYDSIGLGHPAQLASLEKEPDLFLLDVMLPEKSGIEVARELRESRYGQRPMIAMSASGMMIDLAKESGLFEETIRKPFDITLLLDRIERHLKRDS